MKIEVDKKELGEILARVEKEQKEECERIFMDSALCKVGVQLAIERLATGFKVVDEYVEEAYKREPERSLAKAWLKTFYKE